MPNVPGLRSPYAKIGRLVYFGRMLDKIRLHAAGRLPADYHDNFGDAKPGVFDTRCCRFLGVSHADIARRALEGGSDAEVLAWAERKGGQARDDDECVIWNGFISKHGWHGDPATVGRLRQRIADSGLTGKPIETFFEYIDFDEGRDPSVEKPWEKI